MSTSSFTIYKDSVSINFNNKSEEKKDMLADDWAHYKIHNKVLNFMKKRGFKVSKDPRIEKDYKCLSKDHRAGQKGELRFKTHRYPAGFAIEFYQEINVKNNNGGFYDFDKFKMMPYLIKLLFINESNKIAEFLEKLGVENKEKHEYKLAEDKIKHDWVSSCHYPQKDMNFKLSDLDGTTCDASYNNTDRDKKIIYNGQIKYFRHWDGRLMRGKVYRNLNNMWWVITNDTEIRNEADFNLFDPTEEDFKIRRIKRGINPKKLEDSESVRQYFKDKGLTYKDITEGDICTLVMLLNKKIKAACKNHTMSVDTMRMSLKVKSKFTRNGELIECYLFVNSHYFTQRECISFNKDGFIGFCGWAGTGNAIPIYKAFCNWCDDMDKQRYEAV
ncbi:hypothetical protein [Clostridium estertheticum]|uniref:Uncharacterized protein n=1 Tax=Clostridium estertheticum subsp. estertheticum TaxID=1552 RepID=A0A1J0GJH4_9CLOT|nr:hypothetical protein [Clostridium estertheticum]APC41554.1 hypothetical protein A7L45_16450 [Clostridium estertheticum subsp. estertheticum]